MCVCGGGGGRRGVHVSSEGTNFWGGGSGACSPGQVLENLDCLGLYFARFHGEE